MRITTQVEISNPFAEGKVLRCSMFVDSGLIESGAGGLNLPKAWKRELGTFLQSEPLELVLANGEVVEGEVCGPVAIRIEGFRKIFNEVMFIDTEPVRDTGEYETFLGAMILAQAQAAVDMLGHRLVPVRYVDCK